MTAASLQLHCTRCVLIGIHDTLAVDIYGFEGLCAVHAPKQPRNRDHLTLIPGGQP